jgi:hypothetical protein
MAVTTKMATINLESMIASSDYAACDDDDDDDRSRKIYKTKIAENVLAKGCT